MNERDEANKVGKSHKQYITSKSRYKVERYRMVKVRRDQNTLSTYTRAGLDKNTQCSLLLSPRSRQSSNTWRSLETVAEPGVRDQSWDSRPVRAGSRNIGVRIQDVILLVAFEVVEIRVEWRGIGAFEHLREWKQYQ